MKLKVDVSQQVLDSKGHTIPGDREVAQIDSVRLRAALTKIELGADDPEQIAAEALADLEDEPMQLKDLIEKTATNRKVKYIPGGPDGQGAIVPDEPEPTAREKKLGGRLAIKVFAVETLELSTAEVKFLEKRSGVLNTPVQHVRLMMVLHPEQYVDEEDEEDDEDDAENQEDTEES